MESEKYFQTSDDARRVREKSFQNEPQVSSEIILRGHVCHYHWLKINFCRQDHTAISLLQHLHI